VLEQDGIQRAIAAHQADFLDFPGTIRESARWSDIPGIRQLCCIHDSGLQQCLYWANA
jgi:hypothetical protein